MPAWGRAVGGVTRVLAERGRAPVGAILAIRSDVPIGAGLSSSAAFEVACALALGDVAGHELDRGDLALAAQRAEHIATGVPCGIQDQMASVFGRAGHALFLDCRTLDIEHVPLPPELAVLVVHSGVPRTLEGSPYAQRRAESEAVGGRLGVRVLRDATFEQVATSRVAGTRSPRCDGSGSSRQPYARTTSTRSGRSCSRATRRRATTWTSRFPSSMLLVECLVAAGARGARLTGAGFGGCVVALVDADDTAGGFVSRDRGLPGTDEPRTDRVGRAPQPTARARLSR